MRQVDRNPLSCHVIKQALAVFFQPDSLAVVSSTESIFGVMSQADVGQLTNFFHNRIKLLIDFRPGGTFRAKTRCIFYRSDDSDWVFFRLILDKISIKSANYSETCSVRNKI